MMGGDIVLSYEDLIYAYSEDDIFDVFYQVYQVLEDAGKSDPEKVAGIIEAFKNIGVFEDRGD